MGSEQTTSQSVDRSAEEAGERKKEDYNIHSEVFIGTMVSAIGLLVLISPPVSEMPRDHPMDPTLIDTIIGAVYIAIGALVFSRAWLKVRRWQ